jgi:hypothetical protein
MKITEILLENKKGVKAPVKPRNFVAKNQQTSGSGAHRDKKKEQKQGYEKHKSKSVAEGFNNEIDMELHRIAQSEDEEMLVDAMHGLLGTGVSDTLEDMINELADELAAKGMTELLNDEDKMIELLMDKVTKEYGNPDIAEGLKDPKDNPCWKGYKPVGTKKKNGKTVPNCVPKE